MFQLILITLVLTLKSNLQTVNASLSVEMALLHHWEKIVMIKLKVAAIQLVLVAIQGTAAQVEIFSQLPHAPNLVEMASKLLLSNVMTGIRIITMDVLPSA